MHSVINESMCPLHFGVVGTYVVEEEMRRKGRLVFLGILTVSLLFSGCGKGEKPQEGTEPSATAALTQSVTTPAEVTTDSRSEAVMLQKLVEKGKLPALEKRIPTAESASVLPVNGTYCDTVSMAAVNADIVTGQLFSEGLFAYAEDGSIVGNVAKDYTKNANSTVYTITLREGLRWSDGTPFTAEDCLFYYNSLVVPRVTGEEIPLCFLANGSRAVFAQVDRYTFTVTFASAKPNFLQELMEAGGICFAPEHYYVNLLPEYMGEDAALAKAKDMGYTSVKEMLRGALLRPWNVVGLPTLNPYILSTKDEKNDVTGAAYEFVRNPYYWKVDLSGKQLPYFDTIAFTRISGESQAMLLTTEGYLTVNELTRAQTSEAETMAQHGGYHIVSWSGAYFAVKNELKNFSETTPADAKVRGIGGAHVEGWYVE